MPDREKPAKEGQLTASPALLTSQSTRRPRECRAFGLQRPRFTAETDSSLEQSGFELRVPKPKAVYHFAYESARRAL